MAAIPVANVTYQGAALAPRAAAAGDTLPSDGRTILHVVNGGGSTVTVTIPSHAHPGAGEAVADLTIPVLAGGTVMAGPFPGEFVDPATNTVAVNYSATTSVTVAGARTP